MIDVHTKTVFQRLDSASVLSLAQSIELVPISWRYPEDGDMSSVSETLFLNKNRMTDAQKVNNCINVTIIDVRDTLCLGLVFRQT
jgi:hypothetical protein